MPRGVKAELPVSTEPVEVLYSETSFNLLGNFYLFGQNLILLKRFVWAIATYPAVRSCFVKWIVHEHFS